MACPCKQETLDFIYNKFLPYLNSGDPKMGDEIFSEDYKNVVSGTDTEFISPVGLHSDITGQKGFFNFMNKIFEEFKWSIQSVLVDGNMVALRSEWTGVFPEKAELPEEKCGAIRMFHYLTMRDGKIVSGEAMMDWFSIFSQAGLVSSPEKLREAFEAGRVLSTWAR